MKILSIRLKEAREENRYTQQEAAKRVGISNGTLSGYERDYRDPDTATLDKLSELYDVSVDWLMGKTNNKKRTLQPHSRKLIDLLDQNMSNEEIFQAFNEKFLVGGIPVSKDEAMFFINFLRTKRAMEKEQGHDHSDTFSRT